MKINGIKALDYKAQGDLLELSGLTGSSLDEIVGMDAALVKVQTDDGDLVEVFAGYALRSVTYDLSSDTYTAVLAQGMEAASAAALSRMAEGLNASQEEVATLQQTVSAQQIQLDEQADALIELAALVTSGEEV